ncbi:MAG: low affinity iron permease family protein [Pedobacter sp.]|uniref:low affinity iron permease family protein n=1 Tax=Pedobacter sp. TaxID=1411316 RepID=UPI003399A337
MEPTGGKKNFFEKFSNAATKFTGSSTAFVIALLTVIIWAVTGPLFHYSETWQLVINTGTTIITFLMVFLIQKAQNKDGKAIQLKLNELIAAHERASNRMVDIEDLTEKELDQLHKFYVTLSELAKQETDIHCSHSIDAAEEVNEYKSRHTRKPKPNKDQHGNIAGK